LLDSLLQESRVMAASFTSWLSGTLADLGTDDSVFGPYIVSILEGEDESQEEKEEGLVGILSDVLDTEEKIQATLATILERWRRCREEEVEEEVRRATADLGRVDLVAQMAQITQEKIATYVPPPKEEMSEEKKKIKEAILQGYSEFADGSEEESEEESGSGPGRAGQGCPGPINNAAASHAEQVEMREKQKAASVAKKDKDKLDLANQKKGQEDRKKKAQAKAAKGERKA